MNTSEEIADRIASVEIGKTKERIISSIKAVKKSAMVLSDLGIKHEVPFEIENSDDKQIRDIAGRSLICVIDRYQ